MGAHRCTTHRLIWASDHPTNNSPAYQLLPFPLPFPSHPPSSSLSRQPPFPFRGCATRLGWFGQTDMHERHHSHQSRKQYVTETLQPICAMQLFGQVLCQPIPGMGDRAGSLICPGRQRACHEISGLTEPPSVRSPAGLRPVFVADHLLAREMCVSPSLGGEGKPSCQTGDQTTSHRGGPMKVQRPGEHSTLFRAAAEMVSCSPLT